MSLDLSYIDAGEDVAIQVIPKDEFAADRDGITLMSMQERGWFSTSQKDQYGASCHPSCCWK